MSTADNLQAAFAGESQANRKYLAFAKKADQDGLPAIAKLFRAAAAAETVHAHAHLRVLKGIGTTEDNVKVAVAGEGEEFQSMYPGFVAEAEAEGNRPALISFRNAMAVEEIHYNMYSDALAALQAGNDLPGRAVHVCGICGNTVYGDCPDKCSVCSAPGAQFSEIA